MLDQFLSKASPSKSSNLYRIQYALEELMFQGKKTTFTEIINFADFNRSAVNNALDSAKRLGLVQYDFTCKEYEPTITLQLPTLDPDYKRFLARVLAASLLGSDLEVIRLLFTLAVCQEPVKINELTKLLNVDSCTIFNAFTRVNEQLNTEIILYDPVGTTMAANTSWF